MCNEDVYDFIAACGSGSLKPVLWVRLPEGPTSVLLVFSDTIYLSLGVQEALCATGTSMTLLMPEAWGPGSLKPVRWGILPEGPKSVLHVFSDTIYLFLGVQEAP